MSESLRTIWDDASPKHRAGFVAGVAVGAILGLMTFETVQNVRNGNARVAASARVRDPKITFDEDVKATSTDTWHMICEGKKEIVIEPGSSLFKASMQAGIEWRERVNMESPNIPAAVKVGVLALMNEIPDANAVKAGQIIDVPTACWPAA